MCVCVPGVDEGLFGYFLKFFFIDETKPARRRVVAVVRSSGWHAAVVAAAGNWVVSSLFISPAERLA